MKHNIPRYCSFYCMFKIKNILEYKRLVIQSKSSITNMHSEKINNFNPTRGNSFKNRAQSMMYFQIKGREQRSKTWLIDSRRDIGQGASEAEIKGGADFKGRELGDEEERM
jgi:hypothetical protein